MQFTLKDKAIYVSADPSEPKEITNLAGGTCYYKTAKDVDSGDTALVAEAAVEITAGTYFVSASKTELTVVALDQQSVGNDFAVGNDLTVTGKLNVGSDLNHDGTKAGFFGTTPDVRKVAIATYAAGGDSGLASTITRVGEIEALLVKLGLIAAAS